MTLPESSQKPTVLLVFSEPIIADTLAIILPQCGYEAFTAYSGEKAVESARTIKPHVMICDVVMLGGMSGVEAAFVIHGFLPDCKMLLTTGSMGGIKMLDKAREDGLAFDVIAMPIHPKDLLAKLAELGVAP